MGERTCEFCKEPFAPNSGKQRFCGKACSTKSYHSVSDYALLIAQGKKQCSTCGEIKDLRLFHRRTRNGQPGWTARCKPCASAFFAARNAQEAARRRNRESKLAKRYGISIEQYERMLADQSFKCAICGCPHDGDEGPLHVDHCHSSLRVRGLLCRPCNAGIGHFGDDQERLVQAAAYLERNNQ